MVGFPEWAKAMNITIERYCFTEKSTVSRLYVDNVFFCYTLEDCDRKLESGGIKEYGKTAIPRGIYQVVINWSKRFNRELPLLVGVEGFEGVRIHPGNGPEHTEGCILPGSCTSLDFVGNSRATFNRLFELMEAAYAAEKEITIEVK